MMMMMRANQMTIELFDAGAGAGVVMVSASGAAMVSAGITAPGSAADVCAAALGAEPALAVALGDAAAFARVTSTSVFDIVWGGPSVMMLAVSTSPSRRSSVRTGFPSMSTVIFR